ncbi:MAG TPA: tetratricopeptide repeat protein [Candidatus Obscuribacterales bacterium]
MLTEQLNHLPRSSTPAAPRLLQRVAALGLALLLAPIPPAEAEGDTWQGCMDQGNAAYKRRDLEEARRLFQRAIDEAGKEEPAGTRLAAGLVGLANTFNDEQRFSQAEPLYRKALSIYESPDLGDNRQDKAECLEGLARLLRASGRDEEAAWLESKARTIWERLWANYTYHAVLCEDDEDLKQAEEAFQAALQYSEHCAPQYGRMLSTLENLVILYDKQGRYAEAEPLCRRSVDICQKVFGADHKKTLRAQEVYSNLLRKRRENGVQRPVGGNGKGD